jgi:signal transduction histidine kinase/PAS domain-containing protein
MVALAPLVQGGHPAPLSRGERWPCTVMPGSHSSPDELSLASLLEARKEDILQRWLGRAQERATPGGLSHPELVDSLPEFLDEVISALRSQAPTGTAKPSPQVTAVAEEHGRQRYRLGFNLNTIVWEYGVLRDVLLELILETGSALPVTQWRVISHAITTGITEGVGQFTEAREQALRASEAQLRLIIDHASAYIYAKDAEGRYLFANKAWEDTFHGGQGSQGCTDYDVFPAEMAEAYRKNDLQVLRTNTTIDVEEWDGERAYRSIKFPLMDTRGQPYGVCGISSEITAPRRMEAERKRALAALERGDACLVLDRDWHIVLVNRHQERLSRTRREDTLGRIFWEVFPSIAHEDSPYWRQYHRVMDERVEVEFEAYYESLELWTGVTAYPLYDGGMVIFFRDITEKKRVETVQDFFLEAGRVLTSSPELDATLHGLSMLAAERLADYCLVDLLGEDGQLHRLEATTQDEALRPLLERLKQFSPRVDSDSPLVQALVRGEPLAAEEVPADWWDRAATSAEHRALLEELAPKSLVIVPLVARGRKLGVISLGWTRKHARPIARYVEMARGVADRAAIAIDKARLYQEAQEAARVREEVVAIVSHDLRNPLSAISMSIAMLLGREDLGSAVTRGLTRISAASGRATRMITDLLDFTQARVGALPLSPRPADLFELTRQVVEEVQLAHPGRELRVSTVGEGRGTWDVDRLAQVLTNVVANAVQHSPPDTPVRVAVRDEDGERVVEVHNQGAPIPPEVLPTLFEPFRRGRGAQPKRGSVGLGLYISQQVVLGHGGRIEVRSTAEEGTTFMVRVPRQPPARLMAPEG